MVVLKKTVALRVLKDILYILNVDILTFQHATKNILQT